MNKTLALILLILLAAALLHSLYSFAQGRIGEGMIIYPLLLVCYLALAGHGKLRERSRTEKNDEEREDV